MKAPLARACVCVSMFLAGCGADADSDASNGDETCVAQPGFATEIVDFAFGDGQDFGQADFPAQVLGGPRGGGCCAGSLHVTSLGEGGFVVASFAPQVIVDGPGVDFIVFENAFVPAGAEAAAVYAELGIVSVSQDGERWYEYPCTADEYPFGSCAGWRPALANAEREPVDAFDAERAGGDPFDLADVGLEWARYVRIDDRSDAPAGEGTFDLDAIGVVNSGCR